MKEYKIVRLGSDRAVEPVTLRETFASVEAAFVALARHYPDAVRGGSWTEETEDGEHVHLWAVYPDAETLAWAEDHPDAADNVAGWAIREA